jgi:hypothetical protein
VDDCKARHFSVQHLPRKIKLQETRIKMRTHLRVEEFQSPEKSPLAPKKRFGHQNFQEEFFFLKNLNKKKRF